ncbi:hypothetical protein [Mesorhizobium sp. M0060]|uniref:hypothetical protein n=1 Tax=Mesorhizobium sp. M0060 TaxID=2956866 RepID=UPI00333574CD
MSPQARLRAVSVPNPYFARAHPADASNPRTIPAAVNVRESAVTTLAARGQLDAAQVAAADRFRALWEAIGGAGASGIDPGRIVVDGGKAREPFNERQVNAGKELARCRVLLGVRGYQLVSLVAGEGHSLHEIAGKEKRARLVAADLLRMSLDDLAVLWRLATRRR